MTIFAFTHFEGEEMGGTYKLEFLDSSPAKVHIVGATQNAGMLLARTALGYTGRYGIGLIGLKDYVQSIEDISKTKLATPLEMVHYTFLIRNVTRAWTHQAVRYRIGTAYVQESLRFLGAQDVYKVLVTEENKKHFQEYRTSIETAMISYNRLLRAGSPAQDARGVLPHHILTQMYWDMSLRTFSQVYNTRWCCQAQTGEWLPILQQMKDAIREASGERVAALITAPIERGEPCGFNASFDRPCTWTKERQLS